MKLLKLTSLSPPSIHTILGIDSKIGDLVESQHVIDINSITDFKCHPSTEELIILYLTSGRMLVIPIEMDRFIDIIEEL